MKAILVIDVEEKDIGRKVNYISVQGGGLSYTIGTMGEDVRLKPLPKRAKADNDIAKGWNWCLDEITGETE